MKEHKKSLLERQMTCLSIETCKHKVECDGFGTKYNPVEKTDLQCEFYHPLAEVLLKKDLEKIERYYK